MDIKNKFKSYSFWVSLASAIILILKVLGARFNFNVDESMISDIFTAFCSVLVILGIISVPQVRDDESKTIIASNKNRYPLINQVNNDLENKNDNIITNTENEIVEKEIIVNEDKFEDVRPSVVEIIDTNDKDIDAADEPLSVSEKEENIVENNIAELTPAAQESEKNADIESNTNDETNSENYDEMILSLEKALSMHREKFASDISKFVSALENEIKFANKDNE